STYLRSLIFYNIGIKKVISDCERAAEGGSLANSKDECARRCFVLAKVIEMGNPLVEKNVVLFNIPNNMLMFHVPEIFFLVALSPFFFMPFSFWMNPFTEIHAHKVLNNDKVMVAPYPLLDTNDDKLKRILL
ncbi:hypothetical protein ACJX0J_009435, partial [Zea mays]